MFDVKDEKVVKKLKVVNNRNNHSHNSKNVKRKNVRKNDDEKLKKTGIIMVILLLFALVLVIGDRFYSNNFMRIKKEKTKYLVYTRYEAKKGDYEINIPYVNIKGDTGTLVNDNIDEYVKLFGLAENCNITYEYDISGIFLSVILKVSDYNDSSVPKVYFRSYIINLNTLDVIGDEALLDFYGISESDVKDSIKKQFVNYYEDLINEEYFHEEECDFKCFMKYRDVSDYLKDINYYIDKGNLVVYKPFIFTSLCGEEDYFRDDDFKFLIAKGRNE